SLLETIGNWAFYNCHNLTSLTVPEGVTEIGDGAFYGCTYIEELNLPSSLLKIGDNSFAKCENLKSLTVLAQTPPQIDARTFFNVNREIPVFVPSMSLQSYANDTYWSEFVDYKAQDIPNSIENITESDIQISVKNGHLEIHNPQQFPVRIYNMFGQQISIEDAVNGVYAIQTGNTSQKVIVN
ncbi:MAG: leucine-rich repeat domain-containing protein, partial [bacterium]